MYVGAGLFAFDDEERAFPGPDDAGRGRSRIELGILPQDRPLELLQGERRLDPERLDQHLPSIAVGGQRIRLAPRPVERNHELSAQAFPEWMLTHQGLELRDQLEISP